MLFCYVSEFGVKAKRLSFITVSFVSGATSMYFYKLDPGIPKYAFFLFCFPFFILGFQKENFELQWKASEISRYKLLQKIACRGTTKATESNQGPNGAEREWWPSWAQKVPQIITGWTIWAGYGRGHSKGKFYYSFSHHFLLHFLFGDNEMLILEWSR